MRRAGLILMALAASAVGAAPPLSGTFDPHLPPKLPPGPIGTAPYPVLLDTQASFDFTNRPTGGYKPIKPADPAAQQLLIPLPSYGMIFPVTGAPQRHALHIYGITNLTPDPISFLSRPFDVAKRKSLTVAWDGTFDLSGGNTIEFIVGMEGLADLFKIALRDGKIYAVTPQQGYKQLATYNETKVEGASVTSSEHRFAITCGALSHACTVTFSQNGQVTVSPAFTFADPSLMPTPPAPRRVYLRMSWPTQEAASVHGYNFRRLTISGDLPGVN